MTSRTRSLWGGVGVFLLLGAGPILAGEEKAKDKQAADASAADAKAEEGPDVSAPAPALPKYKPPIPPKAPGFVPPKRGRPAGRVAGGTRGAGNVALLAALVPNHIGRTVSEEPSLFWYIDRLPEAEERLVFALIDEDSIEPIREIILERPAQPGVQRISLATYGVKLEAGVEYEWSVALVLDPDQRSSDVIASGWIDRLAPPPKDLASQIAKGGATGAVTAYAEAGCWYDALAAISDLIDRNPDDASLRAIRASLLRQVGFEEVARAEL